ncbi:MAG: rhodanese-like domain-containing protein [Bacteroidia bacterium]|nr:rhodanese-like domain-containing protein [Bacteroidia bacterium]
MKTASIILTLVIGVLIFSNASCQQAGKDSITSISAPDFKKLVDSNSGVLLDVRTPEEYAEGHIKGALNIDYRNENFKQEIEKLDKSKNYNVYCRSGGRSMNAATIMTEMGFKNTTNLEGGIIDWKAAGFEVQKK